MSDFINTIDVLGDDAVIDSLIDRSITELKDNTITTVGSAAFNDCKALIEVDLPNAIKAGACFQNCTALTSIRLHKLTEFTGYVIDNCPNLANLYVPNLTKIGYNQICQRGSALTMLDLPNVAVIDALALSGCRGITRLLLRKSDAICTLNNTNGIGGITNRGGYIYVPSALIDSYKSATNWSTYADYFRALEDYTVDGTVTGELDETKI